MKKTDIPRDKEYLTPQEVAELLMVSPVTVRQWAQKGRLKASTTPGGHRRFHRNDVMQFASTRKIRPGTEQGHKILIVDDDALLAGFLHEMFLRAEKAFDVRVVHDGFSAGTFIQSFLPEIILLDIMMPGVNGIQVCSFLKQNPATANIHVIAMTGYSDAELAQEILDAGATICLQKPVKINQVLETVEALLSGANQVVS